MTGLICCQQYSSWFNYEFAFSLLIVQSVFLSRFFRIKICGDGSKDFSRAEMIPHLAHAFGLLLRFLIRDMRQMSIHLYMYFISSTHKFSMNKNIVCL